MDNTWIQVDKVHTEGTSSIHHKNQFSPGNKIRNKRGQRRDSILVMDVGHTSSNIHGSINKRTERLEVNV